MAMIFKRVAFSLLGIKNLVSNMYASVASLLIMK